LRSGFSYSSTRAAATWPLRAASMSGVYELGANLPPSITSASFDGRKRLTITGAAFDESPTVLINEQDKSDRISSSSDTEAVLVGKAKKLKLKSGDNTIQIVTSGGLRSNIVIVGLQ